MFTKAGDWNMVSESVCKTVHRVKMFKVDNARIRFLSATEIMELLAACDHVSMFKNGKTEVKKQDHLKPIIIFALNTGCRKSEILSLKWDQVDLIHGFINLTKTKNGESRQIPINDVLRVMLKGLIRRLDVPWVFYNPETGTRFTDCTHSFYTACKKAGIQDFHFHDLRHTFASHLVMGGVDLTTVSRLMGHKSLAMTLRYAHLAPDHLANAVNVLNSTMNPISTVLAQLALKKAPSEMLSA
jgi:integrase